MVLRAQFSALEKTMTQMEITMTCPYCNNENVIKTDVPMGDGSTSVMHCDSESGGCDRTFAYRIRSKLSVWADSMAIDFDGAITRSQP
jgi:transcription elongation factor Elf1